MKKTSAGEASPDFDDFGELLSISVRPPEKSPVPIHLNELTTPIEMNPARDEFLSVINSGPEFIPDLPIETHDYVPLNPVDVPHYYPQYPMMKLLTPEFMQKLEIYDLFYFFFYFPQTTQQFFAAKELSRRGWQYFIELKTWIRQISENLENEDEIITAKYEYYDVNSTTDMRIAVGHFDVRKAAIEKI